MEQIIIAYGFPKETVTIIMMLNKKQKKRRLKVHSPVGKTIVIRVLQGDTLALYLFILCQESVLQMLIDLLTDNRFTLKKAKK